MINKSEEEIHKLYSDGKDLEVIRLLEPHQELTPSLRFGLALAQLRRGDWKRGWKNYEARLDDESQKKKLNLFPLGTPPFYGSLAVATAEELATENVLVLCEQGLGDTLQFVGWFKENLDQSNVGILCHPLVEPLLKKAFVYAKVYTVHSLPKTERLYSKVLPSLSLPFVFRKEKAEKIRPWILESYCHERFTTFLPKSQNKKIGIVWKGNPTHQRDAERSTQLENFLHQINVGDLQKAQLISLQVEITPEEEALLLKNKILPLGKAFRTFVDSASVMRELDLVISVDTASVHLAGAMGKFCLLLNAKVPEWRWGWEEGKSLWYESVYCFSSAGEGRLEFRELFKRLEL